MSKEYSQSDVDKLYRQGAKIQKRIYKMEDAQEPFLRRVISWFPINLILISLAAYLIAAIFGNIFTYNDTTYYFADEDGQRIDSIMTFVCYTTKTGACYHAEDCEYLRKSRNKTTVYEAEMEGYEHCSKCTPLEPTVIPLAEPGTRIITKQEVVKKKTTSNFFITILGTTLLGTIIKGIVIFTAPKLAQKKLNKLDKLLVEITSVL